MRRFVTWMVHRGNFSLLDVRKLYIDELFEYYDALLFEMEASGEIKQGTYDSRKKSEESVIDALRRQFSNLRKNK